MLSFVAWTRYIFEGFEPWNTSAFCKVSNSILPQTPQFILSLVVQFQKVIYRYIQAVESVQYSTPKTSNMPSRFLFPKSFVFWTRTYSSETNQPLGMAEASSVAIVNTYCQLKLRVSCSLAASKESRMFS